ncbi:MAG TPA: glyoxalase [Gammaproteobacteria bacterium]|nr:glyoxalase [Gammaproteobacteria bacterium]
MQDNLYQGIHHISLLVQKLESSLAFYCNVLGLEMDESRPDMAFNGAWLNIGCGQQIHLLVLPNPDAGVHRPEHGGRDRHGAFRVTDIEVLKQRLDRAGIAYTCSRSGRAALFCRDPDDNALEFMG